MKPIHLTIKEEGEITSDTLGKVKSDGESEKKEKLGSNRYEELRNFLLEYNDEHSKTIFHIGYKKLSAPRFVGSVETSDGISVEILPKIDLAKKTGEEEKSTNEETRVIFNKMLFSYWQDARLIEDVHVDLYKNERPLEFLFQVFFQETAILARRGLARAYVTREDNLHRFKGKLDMVKQLRYNFAHKERFYVHYDEFIEDRPVNRLIKKALNYGLRLAREPDNRRRVMQLLPLFDSVKNVSDWQSQRKRVYLQRNIKDYYDFPLKLALMILSTQRPSSWHANENLFSFIYRMYDVFENYVAKELSAFAEENSYELKEQDAKQTLMQEEGDNGTSFKLKPDIVMFPEGGNKSPILILDTKWKRIDVSKNNLDISQADIYQLYSYGKRYERAKGSPVVLGLLYPRNKNFTERIILKEPVTGKSDAGLKLHIIPVDLSTVSGKQEGVLQQTKKILKDVMQENAK